LFWARRNDKSHWQGQMNKAAIDYQFIIPTPVGKLGLLVAEQSVRYLSYVDDRCKTKIPKNGLAATVYQQLLEYFQQQRKKFDLPLSPVGTDYQKRVWQRLLKISYGQSFTYGDIAEQLGSGPRAVGNACRWNPISIIVPCHRVVSKTDIGGYTGKVAGEKVERKIQLLEMEGGL